MKKLLFALLAGSALFATSCTKTGPQGPRGYDGNANVVGENSFTVNTWSYSNGVYYAEYTDNNITTAVANYGMVEIYKLYSNGWTNLPDINGITSTVYNFSPNYFVISILNSDGSNPAPPGAITFRVVVIPSSVRLAHPNTNWKNYDEAMAALHDTKAVNAPVSTQ